MLASMTERIREIGIGRTNGAKSCDLITQILIESVVTATIGAVLGLVASAGMTHVLILLVPSENTPIIEPLAMLISFSPAIVIGIVAGLTRPSKHPASIRFRFCHSSEAGKRFFN